MMAAKPRSSIAYRQAFTIVAAVALWICVLGQSSAWSFEIFGLKLFGDNEEVSETIIDPVRYILVFDTGSSDKTLREALEEGSALFSDQKKPVSGALGLVIKARDDRDRLLAVLYEKAHYGGVVTVLVNGTSIDDLPPDPAFGKSGPVPVRVKIDPDPVFILGRVALEGDAARFNPSDYGLVTGGQAGSAHILKAADKIVAALKEEGRPLAHIVARDVIADHDKNTVDVTINAEGGPIATTGNVTVEGTKDVDSDFVQKYSRLNNGKPYSPENLKKSADRLRKLGVFSSVTIKEADHLSADGTIPLTIEVSEGKQRYFGVGAQFSSLDGLGLQGYWGHRNLFGQAESLRIEGSVARLGETTDFKNLDYSAAILFSKPGAFSPLATFNAGLMTNYLHPESYEAAIFTGSAGISYELTDWDTLSGGSEISWSDTYDAFGHNRYLTASVPLSWQRDTTDNRLDPTHGYRTSLSMKPSYEFYHQSFFSSFEGSISTYRGLGEDGPFVVAGKFSAGTLAGVNNLDDIPATRRFYAGGGGSVRGFAYQEISPRNALGEALGGRSHVFGSIEVRIDINETFGVVPFIDAANVASTTVPDFKDIRLGAGVGIRYATSFGPLRLDFAVPINPYRDGSRFGIYAGIGQSF